MPLEPGDSVPTISAPNQEGDICTPPVSGLTVVYFYVEDGTPGCETQAEQFAFEADVYEEAGVSVYGVSTDDVASHRAFAEELDLSFDVLADPAGELCDAFDVERDHADRPERTTFVIEDGEVLRTYRDVNPDGHARELLMELYDDGVVELAF